MANKKPKKTVKSGIPKLDRYIRPEKEMLYASYAQASNYFSLPYYSMVKLAKEADANIHIRKGVLVDMKRLETYIAMSKIELINGSCADQEADVIVNAANDGLWAGGGICGVIFRKAGMAELTAACKKYKTPLNDGDAVITPAFNMTNAKAIIHAVGPNFSVTPKAFKELFDAYYNSLKVMMDNGYHSISFPLISSGIFGGSLADPVGESTKQCCRAYKKFTADYPEYDIDVKVCVYSAHEVANAQAEFDSNIR